VAAWQWLETRAPNRFAPFLFIHQQHVRLRGVPGLVAAGRVDDGPQRVKQNFTVSASFLPEKNGA